MSKAPDRADTSIATRWPEVIVAGVLVLLAILVITDSLRAGIDWADDGPRSGYFPFYIGLLLLASSATVLITQLLRWRREAAPFIERDQARMVVAVFVPMLVYVALITGLGIYVPSMLLIGYFMRRHGGYGWLATAAVSVAVPVLFYFVFERWFLVLLPKGPVEQLIGL